MGGRRTLWAVLTFVAAAVVTLVAVVIANSGGTSKRAGQVVGFTPPPRQLVSLWIGDSFTQGGGAASSRAGEACLTADVLGWLCRLDAEGGTGYVSDGHHNNPSYRPVGDRIPIERQHHYDRPDVVVLDVGRNDGYRQLTAGVPAGIDKAFNALARTWPAAHVVVIAPYHMYSTPSDFAAIRKVLRAKATARHWLFVDPIGEGWINATTAKMVIQDGVHPTPAGHEYLARHIAADIRRAMPELQASRAAG